MSLEAANSEIANDVVVNATEETRTLPQSIEALQQEVASLKFKWHRLTDDLKMVDHTLKHKMEILTERMVEAGIDNVRVSTEEGSMTLFPTTRRFVYKKADCDKDSYLSVLRTLPDFADLVVPSANANSVTARAKEMLDGGKELPLNFTAVAEVRETLTLGTRR